MDPSNASFTAPKPREPTRRCGACLGAAISVDAASACTALVRTSTPRRCLRICGGGPEDEPAVLLDSGHHRGAVVVNGGAHTQRT